MSHADVARILALSVEERLRLIELIWESLNANSAEIPLSDAHLEILAERMAEHERDPDDVITHEELLTMVRRRR
ncbi:MAG: addiction module protein [Polyangiaceae bacterium]|nr:addiction module protein [Polyangiaceae bacterium]